LAHGHAHSSEQEEVSPPEGLDEVEPRERGDDVDGVGDDLDGEAALGETRVLEVLRAVVEDEVDARELLEALEEAARQEAFADGALEAVEVGRFGKGEFVVVVGEDLVEFVGDAGVVGRDAAEFAEGEGGLDGREEVSLDLFV
jgi:hypothetical protein